MDVSHRKQRKQEVVRRYEGFIYYTVAKELLALEKLDPYPRDFSGITQAILDDHTEEIILRVIRKIDVAMDDWDVDSEFVFEQVSRIVAEYIADLLLN